MKYTELKYFNAVGSLVVTVLMNCELKGYIFFLRSYNVTGIISIKKAY